MNKVAYILIFFLVNSNYRLNIPNLVLWYAIYNDISITFE